MLVILEVLAMFTGAAMGLVPVCNFTQKVPCYGALGHPLHMQLLPAFDVILKKGHDVTPPDLVLRYRNHTTTLNKTYSPRWSFATGNTSVRITSAKRGDMGRYFLENFDSENNARGIYYLQVIVEEALSTVEVKDSCYPGEKRTVSCSSDGDQLHFSWTLSGITLGHQLVEENRILLLDKDDAGNVTCHVENHVSCGDRRIELHECPDFLSIVPVCRFNQTDVCYGAVGHPLYLQLKPEYELTLKKKHNESVTERIFRFRDQKILRNPSEYPRWQFVPDNRMVIINRAEKSDSGTYILDTYDSGGATRGSHQLQLVIEAVVSSVEVEDSCFSSGKRRVSCSSDGDQVRLSWTLSGIGLGHQLADGNNTLLLDKEASGNVTCYIENHVSRSRTTVELHKCPAIVLLTVGVLGIICLLSLLGGFHIYARICMNKRTKQHSTAAESNEYMEEEEEVVETIVNQQEEANIYSEGE